MSLASSKNQEQGNFNSSFITLINNLAQTPIQCVPWTISAGVNRQGLAADHSPPSSAELKNGEAIPPNFN
jgi:hypothetical protein